MTPEERLEAVSRAKELSRNPVFVCAVEAVKDEHMRGLLSALPGTPEAMLHHSSLIAIDGVVRRIESVLADEMFLKKAGYL